MGAHIGGTSHESAETRSGQMEMLLSGCGVHGGREGQLAVYKSLRTMTAASDGVWLRQEGNQLESI